MKMQPGDVRRYEEAPGDASCYHELSVDISRYNQSRYTWYISIYLYFL